MTFRMNPSDTTRCAHGPSPSCSTVASISSPNPQLFFKGDRFRIFGKFSYKNREENFYGIGYNTNNIMYEATVPANTGTAACKSTPKFLFRLGNSNIFAGPQIDINYDHLTGPASSWWTDPTLVPAKAGGTANGYNNFNSGLGFLLTYDSRDVPANAYRGMYLDFRGMMYAKFIGSDQTFYRLEMGYRQYKSLGRRRVLAWTAGPRTCSVTSL